MVRAAPALRAELDVDLSPDLLARLHLIRTFENTVQSLFQKGEVHGEHLGV